MTYPLYTIAPMRKTLGRATPTAPRLQFQTKEAAISYVTANNGARVQEVATGADYFAVMLTTDEGCFSTADFSFWQNP